MSSRMRMVVSAVVIAVVTTALFVFHRERWAELMGAIACAFAIADAIQKPASVSAKCLLIVGFLLWIVELVLGGAFNLFPQTTGTVGALFLCGYCLVFTGNQMRLRGRPK
jgi:hypothetical protein